MLSKTQILVKNQNSDKKSNIGRKIKHLVEKIQHLIKNKTFGQKSKFWSKI